jgi:bifunctional UDP-N-acetylglucosamine pyrophosphorylase/glucosamine-1-phosphate N-acetyltransferase
MKDHSAALEAKRQALLASGVEMLDPAAVYVEDSVVVEAGTLLLPGTILRGDTVVGENCQIGPNTMLTDCTVGAGSTVNASQCEESEIGERCQIGPYTHIRPHCVVGEGSKIGAFVQLKNCTLGVETKMAHLTYVGDSDVGNYCNFGCGVVTCNYDGFEKFRTVIGDKVFVGCNTNLVPPVAVGDGAYIAAATTVTEDVPEDAMAIGRTRQQIKEGWAAANRERREKER